ncbi:MAG: hypothetical protein U5S82_24515 [Gammaproteobacteria bacterium]|nr:hypothetical protein [Gammaproteobacteria bacterium]
MGLRTSKTTRLMVLWIALAVLVVPMRVVAGELMHHGVDDSDSAVNGTTHGTMNEAMHAAMDTSGMDCPGHQDDSCCEDASCGCLAHVTALTPPAGLPTAVTFGIPPGRALALPELPSFTAAIYRPPRA